MTPDKNYDSKWSVLSGVRFLLAACVVITHSAIVAPGYFFNRWLGHTGYPAVFSFLMISGYSIAASITARPDGYVYRRFKRIYPAYTFAIALSCSVTLLGPLHLPEGQILTQSSTRTVVGNLLMLQGILVPVLATNGALWSLSIEWWCYMLGALLSRVGNRISLVLTIVSFIAMMAYCMKVGVIGGTQLPFGWIVPMMAWAWLTGFVYFRQKSKVNFLLMTLLPMVMFDILVPQQFASVVLTLSALAILFAGSISIRSEQIRRLLNFLGDASYPLYLVHSPLLFFLTARTPIKNGNVLVLMIIAAVLSGYYLATIAWNGIARRMLVGREPSAA